MVNLFIEGGVLFMGLLTILLLLVVVIAVRTMIRFSGKIFDYTEARKNLSYIRSIGLLAFVVGIFAQFLGLYQAFSAIQEIENISPSVLVGGLKVSMITTIYGTLILIISLILWLVLDARLKSANT